MDFSNYGKIKKIFYIVAIISMLLSIKSRVFGATIEDFPTIPEVYEGQNFIIYKNSAQTYYYLAVLNGNINDNNHVFYNTNVKLLTFPSGSGKMYRTPVNNGTSWTFLENIQSSNGIDRYGAYVNSLLISSVDIYDPTDNEIVFPSNFSTVIAPSFDNASEIENGNPDGVYISPADYSQNDNLYFHLLQIDTGLSNSDQSIYYYSDKTFTLNKDSDYYRTWADPSIEGFYYYIPRYKLGLSQNTSYLYVLNNSKNAIQNSYGLYSKDIPNGIYDVVQSDTAGVITATEEESDRMKNIEQSLIQNQGSIDNIQNSLSDTNVSQDTETNIDTSLDFDNSAPQFSSLFNGYFSRLTSIVSDLGNYQDIDIITIQLPIPFTNSTIPIRSDLIFSNQNTAFLKNIATLLWYFIFGRYFLYFLINIYWSITNGQFFKSYLTQKEAITSDML